MRKILILLCGLFLVSCSTSDEIVAGNIRAKSAKRVGGRGFMYVQQGNTIIATGSNNETSFRDGISGLKTYFWLDGAKDIAKNLTEGYKSVTNTKTAAGVSNTAAKEGTKQIGLQEATKQQAIAAEAAAE